MELILQAIKALLNKVNIQLRELAKFAVPANWEAAEGEPGYVLNRTHWAEKSGVVHKLDGKFLPNGVPYSEYKDVVILDNAVIEQDGSGNAVVYNEMPEILAGSEYTMTLAGNVLPTVKAVRYDPLGILLPFFDDDGNVIDGFLQIAKGVTIFGDATGTFLGGSETGATLVGQPISITGREEIIHKLDEKYLQIKSVMVVQAEPDSNNAGVVNTDTNWTNAYEYLINGGAVEIHYEAQVYHCTEFNPDWMEFECVWWKDESNATISNIFWSVGSTNGEYREATFSVTKV